ncbi:NAD(P)/FAD-dependent oxidoreductase [Halorussus salinisoli]|uniref:NAD(P)/FAD-dependent oxidoreductase n=1 Tax=Halorussus salinisoli TaxID=2558242 RepID=UPI0010C218C4|nr:FAD/NAD(P)-binding oxidoreductase [Halorussus salinisoli]
MTETIVVVGGGTGGTVLANRLAEDLASEIDAGEVAVKLVTDDPNHTYKPTFLYVAFGEREVADARRPLSELLDDRVDLHVDRVVDVDAEAKRIERRDGKRLGYDHLAIATGASVVPEETPGLKEGGHHFYNPDGTETLRAELASFEEGHLVLSVVGTPHMCPAAPLEFVFMADDWLRKQGRREDVDITYTYPIGRAHGLESIAEWATPRLDDRDIAVETFFNATEVDPDEQVVSTAEGTEMEYDLLVAIPPHTGDDLISAAGLGDDGWADVDNHTLESERADDVYVLGDSADVPTSKAGSVAHFEAGVVADRIASRVRGRTPTARYDGKTVCFIETGMDEATFVKFNYGEQPSLPDPSRFIHWAKLSYNESYWLTAKGLL